MLLDDFLPLMTSLLIQPIVDFFGSGDVYVLFIMGLFAINIVVLILLKFVRSL